MDDHIGWPQVRVNVQATTYQKLFTKAHAEMVLDNGRHRPQYYASTIVDKALNMYLDA